ncbi:MAG: prepilin-type N-terminal cleavage/methylation domain-containing protein [Candidatus Berkelbacteria bacterium]|nr:prepilin-type N-terminal cleavage/methylation domain-containing protein [Candidatus Berkelbacteria bacterium]
MKKSLLRAQSRRGKGFTLIELLIVIAIIAILAIIIIVAINPAAMLQKSRDSQRFSDVTSLATAVNLYLADNKEIATLGGPFLSTDGLNDNARKLNDGTGWITGLDFTTVTSGAPLAALPLDPVNDATYHYVFGVSAQNTYEIMVAFEHSDNTPKHSADGGNSAGYYEVGTDLTTLVDGDY